jgi:hypothetical protein
VRWLLAEGGLVEPVADEAEGEDGRGEGVAGCLGAAAEEVRQDLVVVLWECEWWSAVAWYSAMWLVSSRRVVDWAIVP